MAALFAKELKRLLDGADIPRVEIAKKLRIHTQMLWLLQAGKRLPTPKMVAKVGRVLQLSPDDLAELHRAAARDRGYKIDLIGELDAESQT
jgi:transcriptional regulator with XRE-family HTH domain